MSRAGSAAADERRTNVEWRLSTFLDALSAEVDRAQDTLSFKSFGRGMSVSLQSLSLEIAVQVRVDEHGQVLFRSAEVEQPGTTVLKLQLREVFQSQLEDIRKPLDDREFGLPLSSLPEISAQQIAALQAISVFAVDDLRRFGQTPALLGEMGRLT